jgi:hypothetical protein
VLSNLAQYLPEVIPAALAVGFSTEGSLDILWLDRLAQYLPKELWSETLALVRLIQDESEQVKALETLAQYLPKELWSEALALVCLIQDESEQVKALETLAQYLPKELWSEALALVRLIQNESTRAEALGHFMFLSQIDWESIALDFWHEILHTLSCLDRPTFIQEIPLLAPGILVLGGEAALAVVVVALREVCEQWR